jgi:hypothetical protein
VYTFLETVLDTLVLFIFKREVGIQAHLAILLSHSLLLVNVFPWKHQTYLKDVQITYRWSLLQFLRLLPVQDFISLFSRVSCHQKYFEIINETTLKMHDFILEFHNTNFYVVSLVVYVIK